LRQNPFGSIRLAFPTIWGLVQHHRTGLSAALDSRRPASPLLRADFYSK
jgi:hypothetical protein